MDHVFTVPDHSVGEIICPECKHKIIGTYTRVTGLETFDGGTEGQKIFAPAHPWYGKHIHLKCLGKAILRFSRIRYSGHLPKQQRPTQAQIDDVSNPFRYL